MWRSYVSHEKGPVHAESGCLLLAPSIPPKLPHWCLGQKTVFTANNFQTAEESSFETLESLAEELAARVIKYFILPKHQAPLPGPAGVRVRIEKPSAVTFADAPVIEVYRSADIQDPFGKRMVSELGTKKPQIPFPLGGRLDEFLQSWKQD